MLLLQAIAWQQFTLDLHSGIYFGSWGVFF
jgi:hypothetical protein